jgi:hypothetical protein
MAKIILSLKKQDVAMDAAAEVAEAKINILKLNQ